MSDHIGDSHNTNCELSSIHLDIKQNRNIDNCGENWIEKVHGKVGILILTYPLLLGLFYTWRYGNAYCGKDVIVKYLVLYREVVGRKYSTV